MINKLVAAVQPFSIATVVLVAVDVAIVVNYWRG